MAPKRLSNSEKQSILELYRQPTETTSTLASRFGVSSSTVSRVLKQGLSPDEYEALVQQKRTGVPRPIPSSAPDPAVESSSEGVAASRRVLAESEAPQVKADVETGGTDDVPSVDEAPASPSPAAPERLGPILRSKRKLDDAGDRFSSKQDNEDSGELDDFQDDLDVDDDFSDLDDYDDEDIESDDEIFSGFQMKGSEYLDVRPIAEAQLPRTCYLVIDRSAELITRPLSDFADLGHIPSDEVEEKTLPIFDNHRVAKRFSNRRVHRIVKIPDSRLLQKTTLYLQAKGITRLLFDGQVYALSEHAN